MTEKGKEIFAKTWVDENVRRQLFIEILYDTYGRNDPEHPMHGKFTGLWEQFLYEEAGTFARDNYFNLQASRARVLAEIEELENAKKEAAAGGGEAVQSCCDAGHPAHVGG